MTLGRRAAIAGGASVLFLGAVGWKVGPRLYNARRLATFAGRRIYDEGADPRALVAAALARGASEHKRVLAIFGGNWCQWCQALDDLMTTDPAIRALVDRAYVVVHLDSAAADELDAAWGHPTRLAVPVLVFLDPDGKVASVQGTIPLEELGGRILLHDRRRVLALLEAWGQPGA